MDVGNGLDKTDLTTRERHHSGFVRPISWLSPTDEMLMTFTTDNSVTFHGFLIYIEERITDTTKAKPPADITTKPPFITTTAVFITSPATTSADSHPDIRVNYSSPYIILWRTH